MTRRLSMAEQEIARAHADISAICEQCRRLGRLRAIAGALSLAAAVAIIGAVSSTTTQASAVSPPLNVRAPFTVVDDADNPIMVVQDQITTKSKDASGKETVVKFIRRGVHVLTDGKMSRGSR